MCIWRQWRQSLVIVWKALTKAGTSGPTTNDKVIDAGVRVESSVQAVKIPGPESNAKQLVVRRLNWEDKKELTERQAAENLCKFTGRSTWKLEIGGQEPIDITVQSPEGSSREDFQIVRLWEEDDWRELNRKGGGAVDRCYSEQEAVELFRKVFGHKGVKKYPAEVRQELTLLVDANPVASVSGFIVGIEDAITLLARQAGYKAVWVVGTTDARKLA
jgi:hypothetical protein